MDHVPREARSGLRRLRLLTWWSTAGPVYAIGGVAAGWLMVADGPGPLRSGILGGVLLASGAGGWLLSRPLRRDHVTHGQAEVTSDVGVRGAVVAGCAGAVLVALLGPQLGAAGLLSPAGLACMTAAVAVVAPRRARLPLLAGGVVIAAGLATAGSVLATGRVDRQLLGTAVLFTAAFPQAIVFQHWMWEVAGRLDQAGHMAAELAVAQERLRFAGELHDIQGHHLQVIALKSELAGRLAESDPAAAVEHMAEVQALARTALQDTREVVHGYRRVSLVDELANSAKVLTSAGIRCPPPVQAHAEELTELTRNLLGLVVRETTTNVLRHSRARHAAVQLEVADDTAVLEVRNDGTQQAANQPPGTGLPVLRDRLAAAGGSLSWSRDGDWFSVTARLPAGA